MPQRILVTDDDPAVLTFTRKTLTRGGFTVETATNGQVALKVLERFKPDLIISDIVMPQMDGVDFFKALRASDKTSMIPVIIITENERYRALFQELGVSKFMEKPIEPQDLLSKVKEILFRDKGQKRVLIIDQKGEVSDDMSAIIEKGGAVTSCADNSADAMAMALTIKPKVLFIDVLFEGGVARQMIRALRCFISLKDLVIVTFTHFDPQDCSDIDALEQIKECKAACDEAGANQYIGRFSRSTFADSIRPFLE